MNETDIKFSIYNKNTSLIVKILYIPFIILFISVYTIHGFIALVISIYIHEIGHYVILKYNNIPINKIKIMLLSCFIEFDDKHIKPKEDFIMSISGPIFGILSVILLYPYLYYFTNDSILHLITLIIILLHSINLLPFNGFDGYYAVKYLKRK